MEHDRRDERDPTTDAGVGMMSLASPAAFAERFWSVDLPMRPRKAAEKSVQARDAEIVARMEHLVGTGEHDHRAAWAQVVAELTGAPANEAPSSDRVTIAAPGVGPDRMMLLLLHTWGLMGLPLRAVRDLARDAGYDDAAVARIDAWYRASGYARKNQGV